MKNNWFAIVSCLLLLEVDGESTLAQQRAKCTDGRPVRSEKMDVLPGFKSPPKGYGEVPFYWWMGDTLTKEHLIGHLDILKKKKISSLQVNYAHSDKGGPSWGLTFKSKPEIFTEEWWKLFGWFMKEAKKRGMTVSLSDYTLGVGQGQYVDAILKDYPELSGAELMFDKRNVKDDVTILFKDEVLTLRAYPVLTNQVIDEKDGINLLAYYKDGQLKWTVPDAGEWQVVSVVSKKKKLSYDPLHPKSGDLYVKYFFQKFEDRFPRESKGGLNFFFSDELNFNLGQFIWNDELCDQFKKRKGYDIAPHLDALFMEVGDETVKYRMDYNDVMVSLSEEYFFEPIYRWHEDRGLIYGCDHGGRGRNVQEFGDYFRTQRWNQGPGSDQPKLKKDIIKTKVAASIAHMYERPRVWLEGFYSSGWGTSSSELMDAIFANFVDGYNLLSLHGLYYSTPGGWWEWAPPCNHFRMPYWQEMDKVLNCTERLSYLLSQGYHRADVAILYPVEPVVAGNGNGSVQCAFKLGQELYSKGVDFDFMDYESLARTSIQNKELRVSGERFKVLVIPSMKTIRYASLQKAIEFQRAGGKVICVGGRPQYTEKGKLDTQEKQWADELFGLNESEVFAYVDKAFTRDFKAEQEKSAHIMHRVIGKRDVYAVYNVKKGTTCYFRSLGGVELWDPFTGKTKSISVMKVDKEGTYISMPLNAADLQLIVFNPDQKMILSNEKMEQRYSAIQQVQGAWSTELVPTMDNRWGDYHWPATPEMIGAEIRSIRYTNAALKGWEQPDYIDMNWKQQTLGFADRFLFLDALPQPVNVETLLNTPEQFAWKPYAFSWRWGVEKDYGHQGYHGLKEEMYEDFIRLGEIKVEGTGMKRIASSKGEHYYLKTHVYAPYDGVFEWETGTVKPQFTYLDGKLQDTDQTQIQLNKGTHSLLLYYRGACTTYLVFRDAKLKGKFEPELLKERPIATLWNGDLSLLPFAILPVKEAVPVNEYIRFLSAPGLHTLSFSAYARHAKIWIDGKPTTCTKGEAREDGLISYQVRLENPSVLPVLVALELSEVKIGEAGGSVIPNPIQQKCGKGELSVGDWGQQEGLKFYSGGMWYRKTIQLSGYKKGAKAELDLGTVISTAQVWMNGKEVDTRVMGPWIFDVTDYLKEGTNEISVLVYNTPNNHYRTIPTRYSGREGSGIFGPVSIRY